MTDVIRPLEWVVDGIIGVFVFVFILSLATLHFFKIDRILAAEQAYKESEGEQK